jgi:DNA-binding transcriptional ArsR family regulator
MDETVEVVRDARRAAALLDPERLRLMEALRAQPDSAAGLARRLGEQRQRLNYHLRVLEAEGLVELHAERRRRGGTERVLRPVARSYVVDPGSLGGLAVAPESSGDRFAATYLIAVAGRAIRELAELRDRARRRRRRLATTAVEAEVRLAAPADFGAFTADLAAAVAAVVAKHDAAGGRVFRVIAGAYQRPIDHGGGTEAEVNDDR